MSQEKISLGKSHNAVIGIMALVALFAPAHMMISEWGSSVIAMTWQWQIYQRDSWFMFHPLMILSTLPEFQNTAAFCGTGSGRGG